MSEADDARMAMSPSRGGRDYASDAGASSSSALLAAVHLCANRLRAS